MAQGTLKIHTENILPIIKKWLYSDKDIFIRELISNACDALGKLQILRDQGLCDIKDEDLKIELMIDKANKTLQFLDTGIGMTGEEVEKYIAQVAFSGAEEFISKYKTQSDKEQIIGHFGLGFYSAYMVAEKVTIDTQSYLTEHKPALWSCDGSSTYTLEEGSRNSRGTTITLYVDAENVEFLEESRIREILDRYCAFLPFPIFLNGTQINEKAPLWLKNSSECTEKEYLDFYHSLYPTEPDPIFWIHLNVDYPFNLKGILYFSRLNRRLDWSQANIKLFCNRVFVSDNCKDVIPEYLMCLKGAIDSPDIPLNVSRSALQMDRTVKQLSSHIAKKVADRLSSLCLSEKEHFLKAWPDIELIIKLGAIQDDKFYERVADCFVWKNLEGEWVSLKEYLAYHPDKVFYTADATSPLLKLYKAKDVLLANSPVDTSFLSFLESKQKITFQRIDGALDSTLLDRSREKTLLDTEGKTEAVRIEDFVRATLSDQNLSVEAKSLSSDEIPAFVMMDESMRRMRDYMALTNASFPSMLTHKRTLVLNTNNKLVASLLGLKEKKTELAQELVHHIYDLALLSQKELSADSIGGFIARSNKVLEELVSL